MNQTALYLVDGNGSAVCAGISESIQRAFRWVLRDYPQVDSALIANWAEDVARLMELRSTEISSPKRYAYAALRGRIHDYLRSAQAKVEYCGVDSDLERLSSANESFQEASDRRILFQQLKASLNERDRLILVLLLQDNTSPAQIAKALHIEYSAAAKAIQRVKERIANAMRGPRNIDETDRSSRFCETRG